MLLRLADLDAGAGSAQIITSIDLMRVDAGDTDGNMIQNDAAIKAHIHAGSKPRESENSHS